MNASDAFPEINLDRFKAGLRQSAGVLTLRLSGAADEDEAVRALVDLCVRLQTLAIECRATQVVVDLTDLQFMSSSAFRPFVIWLSYLQEAPATEKYGVRFLTNPKLHWQRRSLHALATFGGDLVQIES